MPDASCIDMEALKTLLGSLDTLEGNGVFVLKSHITRAWTEAHLDCKECGDMAWTVKTGRCAESDYRRMLEELDAVQTPTKDTGHFLDRVFSLPPQVHVYWGTSPALLGIHDALEKVWDAWNGLEMRDKPEEILEDLFIAVRAMGATQDDILRVKKQLAMEENANRPMSVFRTEIRRLETLRSHQNAKKEEARRPDEEGTEQEEAPGRQKG